MQNQRVVITIVLLIAVIAGATLQAISWNSTHETNLDTAGEFLTLGALVLLAIFAPRHARRLNEPMRDWRINLLFGVVVVAGLLVLLAVVYSRYYEPLIQSVNTNNDANSDTATILEQTGS